MICVQNNVIQKEKSHTDSTDLTDLFVASNGSHYASQENSEGVKIREIRVGKQKLCEEKNP